MNRKDAVLWVTDQRLEQKALKSALAHSGCDVDRVEQAVALTMLAARDYHVVLLDMTGAPEEAIDLLRAIRSKEEYGALPVILVTGKNANAQLLARGFMEGAHDHIDEGLSERSIEARLATARQWRAMVLRIRDRASRIDRAIEERRIRTEYDDARAVQRAALPTMPRAYGPLMISGDLLPTSEVRGDVFDVVADEQGRVSIFALSASGKGAAAVGLVTDAQTVARRALEAGDSIQILTSELHEHIARAETSQVVSMALLRFSADASTVEVVNAGYPPILATRGSSRVISFGTRSKPFGLVLDESHPVEFASVPKGSTFAIASDGLHASDASKRELADILSNKEDALTLATAKPSDIRARMQQILGTGPETPRDDATLIVIAIDPEYQPTFPAAPPSRRGFLT